MKVKDVCFVFDLDDTLYPEKDYVLSGMKAVCSEVEQLCGVKIFDKILSAYAQDTTIDWLGLVCRLAGLPPSLKTSLLWVYRLHLPDLKLEPDIERFLLELRSNCRGIAVLTDGRCVSQYNKITALGLRHLVVGISEIIGSEKPNLEGFYWIQNRILADHYIYVGDNPYKDFKGCKELGWTTIFCSGFANELNKQALKQLPASFLPDFSVSNLREVRTVVQVLLG